MNHRGATSLFTEIFTIDSTTPDKQRKGRSELFNQKKNECLTERYWYFGEITGLRYDLLLRIIGIDFFLSDITVHNILQQNRPLLHMTRKAKPTKKDLEKKWPQYSWEKPELSLYI